MTRALPDPPDIDQYRRQAKELLRARGEEDATAIARIRANHPKLAGSSPERIRSARFALADAQLVLARELGFPSWPRLKAHVERLKAGEVRAARGGFYWYADRAGRVVSQLRAGGRAAFETARRWHPDLANATDTELAAREFQLDDARAIVAREHGFESWDDFVRHLEAVGQGPHEYPAPGPIESADSVESQERFRDAAKAIQQARPDGLERLLAADPGLAHRRGPEGHTLLLLAAQERSRELVELLLGAGADPDEANDSGWTPLHQSAYGEPWEPDDAGHGPSLAVMEALLAAGADVRAECRGSGGTPLLQALFWGIRPLAERLAREAVVPRNLRTAAGLGRLDLLEAFFDASGALRAEAGAGRGYAAPHAGFPDFTPGDAPAEILADALVYAACNGRLEAADALLDRGADPNLAPYQETPLFAAVRKGHAGVARRLLERGADVDARASWASMTGLTALHHAVSVSRLDMGRLLVEAGADLDALDGVEQATPEGWARFFENADIERLLVEARR
jgi:hypothetical protein